MNWVLETEKDPIDELDGSGTAKAVRVATTNQIQCVRTERSPETEKDPIDKLDGDGGGTADKKMLSTSQTVPGCCR